MVTEFSAIGTEEMVRARFAPYQNAGINALTLRLDSDLNLDQRILQLERIMDLLPGRD